MKEWYEAGLIEMFTRFMLGPTDQFASRYSVVHNADIPKRITDHG
jgi:hypothetical protein